MRIVSAVRRFCTTSRVTQIGGQRRLTTDTQDVALRGLRVQGKHADLPNLLFFVDYLDAAENWLPFFLNPRSQLLDYRNVFILHPRNFGQSDHCNKTDGHPEDLAADVERFMYTHRISTATLAGHGFGARTALLTGCYRPRLVTGVAALDYAPQDYRSFEISRKLKAVFNLLSKLDYKYMSLTRLKDVLAEGGFSPKLQALAAQSLRRSVSGNEFLFNLDFAANHWDDLVSWRPDFGLYPGRACFMFPEYSDYVFLSTNTVSMHKVCPRLRRMEEDVLPLRSGSDNPAVNHWIYEDSAASSEADVLLTRFVAHFDGVHVLLHDRQEVQDRVGIPTIPHERKDMYSGRVAPGHYHHNWRFRQEQDSH